MIRNKLIPSMQAKAAEENDSIRVKQWLPGRVVLLCLIGLIVGLAVSSGLLEAVSWRSCRGFASLNCDGIGRLGVAGTEPSGMFVLAAPVPAIGSWIISPTAETETPDSEPVMAKSGKIAAVHVFFIAPKRNPFNTARRKAVPLYLYYQSLLC